jgi:hypothetical protein
MMPRVPDELLEILTSFHREVLLPDMQRMVDAAEARLNARFDDVDSHFDSIYQRFDRLETEYQMLVAGVRRLEEDDEAE